jgi:hypothetical protein
MCIHLRPGIQSDKKDAKIVCFDEELGMHTCVARDHDIAVYKPWGLTRYREPKHQEQRYQTPRSPQTLGVKAMSDRDSESIGNGLSRGLRISLVAGVGAFLIVVNISMYFTGHSFHHGH